LNPEDKSQLIAIYQNADIFLFPTLKEHLGLVLVEAMACGLPVIARNVGGIASFLKDG